jgi:hypothetical protein
MSRVAPERKGDPSRGVRQRCSASERNRWASSGTELRLGAASERKKRVSSRTRGGWRGGSEGSGWRKRSFEATSWPESRFHRPDSSAPAHDHPPTRRNDISRNRLSPRTSRTPRSPNGRNQSRAGSVSASCGGASAGCPSRRLISTALTAACPLKWLLVTTKTFSAFSSRLIFSIHGSSSEAL